MSADARLDRRDALLALFLLLGVVAYLAYLPRTLGSADEGHFLYEAKRIRDGEVIYRDFFQFVTPGAPYIMALLYWLFGTTIDTARIGTAVLHGLTAVVMFATGRALGVRRALALVAPVAFLALCQPAWQFASWHWFSTFFTVLVLFAMVRAPWSSRPAAAVLPGLAAGMLISVQQQKGMAVMAGVLAIVVLDHLAGRRFPPPPAWRDLATRIVWFGVGIAVIVLPVLGVFIWLAGFDPVFDALVLFPLVNYRNSFQTTWGSVFWITQGYANYTYPLVLKYLPVVILPAAVRAAVKVVAGTDRDGLRRLIILIVSCGAAVLSIWYFPDFIHIAFIAPVLLVACGEALEWGTTTATERRRRVAAAEAGAATAGALLPPRLESRIGLVVAALLIGPLLLHLGRNAKLFKQQFWYGHDTAFGRIDYPVRWEGALIDHTRRLLEESHEHVLFAYPNLSTPYLTIGAKNPTPYQYFFSPVSPKQHTERVLALLNERTAPLVVLHWMTLNKKDPVYLAVLDNYELVQVPAIKQMGEFPALALYRRKERPAAHTDGAAN